MLMRLLKACVSGQEKPAFCNQNGATANPDIGDLPVNPPRGKIEVAGPPNFYALADVNLLT